jgi:HNH endonuclease
MMDCDGTTQSLIQENNQRLSTYTTDYSRLSWRKKVLLLVETGDSLKELGKHTNPEAAKVGARERIKLYLVHHVGIVVSARELEVVAGISEYARRIRELRVEDGYKILTGHSNEDPDVELELGPSDYILINAEPDRNAAHRWYIANRIRRDKSLGSQAKVLAYLRKNIGEAVTTEELSYVANGAKEYARRTRELRTEEGYQIATKFTGRPDLDVGEYVLESSERIAEPHDRRIPFDVQKIVYERDNNTCRMCSWTRAKWTRQDPRILELHHLETHASGGHNTPENLVVLCSKCHDEVHAGRLNLPDTILP